MIQSEELIKKKLSGFFSLGGMDAVELDETSCGLIVSKELGYESFPLAKLANTHIKRESFQMFGDPR